MTADVFEQHGYRCRLEWGRRGARAAAARGDVLVVVDVLSFSSAVATAVARGGVVYPCAWEDDPAAFGARVGAEVAVPRGDVPAKGRFSLSPPTFDAIEPGTLVVLASPNGATCSRYGREVPQLFVGALVNARAVADAVAEVLRRGNLSVTVLACGERWKTPSEDGDLRFAIEDLLGAGAILSYLPPHLERSPEALVCEAAFRGSEGALDRLLAECGSGRELHAAGYPQDVAHSARLNAYDAVPSMHGERIEQYRPPAPADPTA